MIKGLIRDSLAYSFSNVVSSGISLMLLPFFTRVLTPADYGAIDIMQMFTAVVKISIPLEIYQALARFYIDSADERARIGYASNALVLTVFNYAVFTAACFVFARPLARVLLQSSDWSDVFRLCVVAIAANGTFYLLQMQSRYNFKSLNFLISSLAFVAISSSITAFSILRLRTGIRGIYYGQIAGATVGATLSFLANRSSYRIRIDLAKLRQMLAFSAPLMPSSLGVFLSSYIDRIAIQRLMSLADVGVYGIAARFSSLTSLLLLGFGSALNPLIYRHFREPETRLRISRLYTWFVAAMIVVAFFFLSFSREILAVFAAPAYQGARDVAPILVVAAFLANMYLFNPGLPIEKKTGILSVINLAGAASNIALNLALVPLLGISGAAFSSVGNALVRYILNYAFSQKYYRIEFAWGRILPALLVASGVAAAMVLAWQRQLAVGLLSRAAVFLAVALSAGLFLVLGDLRRHRAHAMIS